MLSLPFLSILAAALLSNGAFAYESDQLSSRLDPPADATLVANAQVDQMLSHAISVTNEQLTCGGDEVLVREVLARNVHDVMGGREWVPARYGRPPMGFGAYAAWLETGPVSRDSHPEHEGLYREIGMLDSPILATFGASSTVMLAGQFVGTDKIDHFWVQGYDYFRRSREGREPERAVAWGTRTELGLWGLQTTGVFSFADLAANYDGFQFYAGLLDAESVVQRDQQGCVVQVRPFDWAEWIDWRYDEVLNPSVFREGLGRPLQAALEEEAAWYCEQDPSLPEIDDAPWIGPDAPSWDSGLDLTDLCEPLADARPRRP